MITSYSFPPVRWLTYALLVLVSAYSGADAAENIDGVEAAKKGLNGRTYFPWYDAKKDDLRRLDVPATPTPADELRQSEWESVKPDSSQPVAGGTTGTAIRMGLSEILGLLFKLLVVALIITLIVLLVRAYLRRESKVLIQATQQLTEDEREGEITRVENLPFQVAAPRGDLLSEAEQCYRAGDYNRAIVYLFSYQLVRLDKTQVIRLSRGKTNRQYVREAKSHQELAAILKNTMMSFEDVFFGHHALAREQFEISWRELPEFQRLTMPGNAVPV